MKYWEKGFHFKQNEENSRIEITDEYWKELLDNQAKGYRIEEDSNGYPINTKIDTKDLELINLRNKRDIECFLIVNRGVVWYNTLSETQKEELQTWYQEWLNVTETLVEPTKPKWLV